jgi:hypothetical protein
MAVFFAKSCSGLFEGSHLAPMEGKPESFSWTAQSKTQSLFEPELIIWVNLK